jgi:ABC-2 type transport system permease protein
MAEARWFRHSLHIAVVEYRRTVRALRERKGRLIFLTGPVVLISLALLGVTFIFTDELRSMSGPIALSASARGTIGFFWVFYIFLTGQKVITDRSRIDGEELLLTTASARTIAGGLVVAETLRILSLIAPPAVIITGMAAYAFSTPVSLLLFPIAVCLFVLSSVIVAYAGGFLGSLLLARSRFVARYKTAIGIVLVFVFFGGYSVLLYAPVLELDVGYGVLAWLPVSWYIDLAAVGSPVSQSWANVAGVLITTTVIFVGGGYAIERLTTAFWFDDPVNPDEESKPSTRTTTLATEDALTSALRPLRIPSGPDTPTRRVAQATLIRTWRNPSKLTFVVLPVFIAGSFLVQVVRHGLVFELAPVIAAIAVPWIAGAAFGLNPLGDERRVLPTTLTTSITGEQFVDGITTPGRLIGLPAMVVLTISVGAVGPYPLIEGMGLMALGFVLLFTSVQLAPLIGMWFPRFSAITVRESREVVPPSLTAMTIHALVTLGIGIIAAASLLVPEGIQTALQLIVDVVSPFQFELPILWVRIGGFGIPLVIAIALTDRARRYAANRFETYTME